MKKIFRLVAMSMVVVMGTLMPCMAVTSPIQEAAAPVQEAVVSVQKIVDANQPDTDNVVGRSTSTYWIGEDRYSFVNVFTRSPSQGYHGPITIQIINFNTSDYVCDVMVYGRNGMLGGGDDQFGNTNLQVINPDGAWAVTSIVMRIRPRPRLLFEAQPKNFQVNVAY